MGGQRLCDSPSISHTRCYATHAGQQTCWHIPVYDETYNTYSEIQDESKKTFCIKLECTKINGSYISKQFNSYKLWTIVKYFEMRAELSITQQLIGCFNGADVSNIPTAFLKRLSNDIKKMIESTGWMKPTTGEVYSQYFLIRIIFHQEAKSLWNFF